MPITASVLINAGGSSPHNYDALLEKLASHAPVSRYTHRGTGEGPADALIKRHIMGREVVVAVTEVRLDFGTGADLRRGVR